MLFLILMRRGASLFADIQKIYSLLQNVSRKIIRTPTFVISVGRAFSALLTTIDKLFLIHNKRIFYPQLRQEKAIHKIFNETDTKQNMRYFSIENRKTSLQKSIWKNFKDHSKNKSKSEIISNTLNFATATS